MLAELHSYYKFKGISAIDFKCPHYRACSRCCSDTFTTAKEAFVSSGYESHELPRILFFSLDSGSADHNPAKKTLEFVRQQEEVEQNVLSLPKNKHWYRTHELAFRILRHFKPGFELGDAKKYFAHANSAKCCMNNPGRAQANAVLFDNCREFIPGEIEILAPDVIITQGEWARRAVVNAFHYLDRNSLIEKAETLPEEMQLISIENRPVLWIHTFHPRNPSSKKNRDNYPAYERVIQKFVNYPSHFMLEDTSSRPSVVTKSRTIERMVSIRKGDDQMGNCEGDYIWLAEDPQTPKDKYPSKEECIKFKFIKLSQLCEIADKKGIGGSRACNAFGGDKGKYKGVSERQTRAVCHGTQPRKFVLTSSAIAYLREMGINNW